jgi:hypothetical protein
MVCTITDINDVLVHIYRTTGMASRFQTLLINEFGLYNHCIESLPETL